MEKVSNESVCECHLGRFSVVSGVFKYTNQGEVILNLNNCTRSHAPSLGYTTNRE